MHSGYGTSSGQPQYTGVSPHVSANTFASHRGEYVSIIFELQPTGEFKCGVTGKVLKLVGVPATVEVSRVSEFICFVHPASGELIYYQHVLLDDEFDFEVYQRLLTVSAKYPNLF